MKLLKKSLWLSAGLLALVSCSSDEIDFGAGQGVLRLRLAASSEIALSAPTRAEIPVLSAPDIADFAVRLTKSDNSYSKTWDSLDDFNAEESFRTGTYTLEAYVGDVDTEGFDAPYFYGAAQVSVMEAKETEASLTASLANSMVSVDYTDAFKNYFSDYSARVHSAGHSYIDFAAGETRAAFISPGEVDLSVTFTTPQGQTTSLQPAGFTAKPRHHYRVRFDVGEGTGNAVLKIIFDDSLVSDDITIDLTDELFSTPAPEVKAEGFVPGSPLEILEGSLSDPLVFTVVARGGMAEANLTVNSETVPTFGREVNLIGASASLQQQLADAGISAVGFFKNPDKLARLDVSGFVAGLPAGTHSLSLIIKDRFTRVSEPVILTLNTEGIEINAVPSPVILGTDNARITVDCNGINAEKAITFKALDKFGVYQDCPVESVSETSTRSFPTKRYIFNITLPDTERAEIPLRMFYNGVLKAELSVPVTMPRYEVEADAFATRVVLKIIPENPSELSMIVNALKVAVASSGAGPFSFSRDAQSGLVTVSGFSPATDYTINTALVSLDGEPATSTPVTTEAATDVPNGDFSLTRQTINILRINAGGAYKTTGVSGQNTTDIVIEEPTGWSSINSKTCYEGSATKNTWFMVPSTLASAGEVVIRNVAYDHNGTMPAVDSKVALLGAYFSRNAPGNIANSAAGELFLGSYSFAGSESRTDGISFGSRPVSVSFDYRYQPSGEDYGNVVVRIIGDGDEVISSVSKNVSASESVRTETLQLPPYPFGKKAKRLVMCFKSSTASIPPTVKPSGDALKDISSSQSSRNVHISANQYKSLAIGSVLTLDNVKLNY